MIRIKLKIDSLILNEPIQINIAVPQPINLMNTKFKNIWFLHCAFSDSDYFFERLNVLDFVDSGYAVICPSLSNSFFINSNKGDIANFLDYELYPYLMELLPLSKHKEDNYCIGLSMGAFGALNWATRCKNFFRAIFLISGVYDYRLGLDPRISTQRALKLIARTVLPYMKSALEDDHSFKENADISKIISLYEEKDIKDFPKVTFLCGDHDYLSLKQTYHFFELFKNKGFSVELCMLSGAHDPDTWRKGLSSILNRLSGE